MKEGVAEAILAAAPAFSERPSVATATPVIYAWLRAHGYKQDRWGNFVHEGKPSQRWHFKGRVFNEQKKIGGDWHNLSSNGYIDSANKLIREAAQAVGKEEVVDAAVTREEKRVSATETRRTKAKSKKEIAQAHAIALGIVAESDLRDEMLEFLRGRGTPERKSKIQDVVLVERDRILESGNMEGRGQNVDLARPPLLPFLSRDPYVYSWTEAVDGHEYTVAIGRPKDFSNMVEVHVGLRALVAFEGVMQMMLRTRRMQSMGEGDIRMRGSLTIPFQSDTDDESDLLSWLDQLVAVDVEAAKRGLYLWCQILAGYGLKSFALRYNGLSLPDREQEAFAELVNSGRLNVFRDAENDRTIVTCK